MSREFCPKCKAWRNVEIIVSRRKAVGPDGKERQVVAKMVHCETCGAFVRSESAEANEGRG
jgi:uncharacterized Zn finger protein